MCVKKKIVPHQPKASPHVTGKPKKIIQGKMRSTTISHY